MTSTATRRHAHTCADLGLDPGYDPARWAASAPLLLPVLLRLASKATWYTPTWLKRALINITFAHD